MAAERILIVDDDAVVRESLFEELCDDYTVEAVASGEEAVERMQNSHYDAVVSDLRMPGMDGIEVLEQAYACDPDMVRILLTGYLDDRARSEAMKPGAPYKIGKPWHDEVQVTLLRAFEHSNHRREIEHSVDDALAVVADVEEDFSHCDGLQSTAEVVVRRGLAIHGVHRVSVTIETRGTKKVVASGSVENAATSDWIVNVALQEDQSLWIRAAGHGSTGERVMRTLADITKRWIDVDSMTKIARGAAVDPRSREQLTAITRRAAVGNLMGSLLHEVATVIQIMQLHFMDLDSEARPVLAGHTEALDALDGMNTTYERLMGLFSAFRQFIQSGGDGPREHRIADLIEPTRLLCGGYVNSRARFHIGDVPDVVVRAVEPLLLQVLINLLRNAAEFSPRNGLVELSGTVENGRLYLRITDQGPGVPEHLRAAIFEPYFTTKKDDDGSGLGLAISAQIVKEHGGDLYIADTDGPGACFVVELPVAF